MKTFFYTFFFIGFSFVAFAQTQSYSKLFNGATIYSYIIKIDSNEIKKIGILENAALLPHKQVLDSINKDDFFVTTASIVDNNCMPLGYYVNKGKVIKKTNLNKGMGNFFLKPNGALIISKNDIQIVEASKIKNLNSRNIIYGIQSGPMLILNDSINKTFSKQSKNKYIRSGVGVFVNKKSERFLVFCISENPISFYDFSLFFKLVHNCKNALCLESSRSVMAIPFLPNNSDQSTEVVCRYIYYDNK